MKTRLFTLFSTLIAISLLFAACSSTASLPSAASTADLSQAAELAIGTLRLEDSAHVLTSEKASQLLILWTAYQSLASSDFNRPGGAGWACRPDPGKPDR